MKMFDIVSLVIVVVCTATWITLGLLDFFQEDEYDNPRAYRYENIVDAQDEDFLYTTT